MYSDSFKYAVREVLELEGVFSDDPKDRGGRTKFGITQGLWDKYRNGRAYLPSDVAEISKDTATEIYHKLFWRDLHCDDIPSRLVATELFEAAVNTGPRRGVKMLQAAYNYNRKAGWDVLREDGILGPITLSAIGILILGGYELPLFKAMNGEQYIWYKTLGDPHHSRGWTRRLPDPKEAQK
jgi:lysozyme family protein